jgi:hypothetical protein
MRCFMANSNHRRGAGALFVLVLALAVASPAAADPITAVYDVQVAQRFSREGTGPSVLEPFAQTFSLAMTFDPGAAPGNGVYGRPVFSPVPLDIPSPPEGLALQSTGSTTHIGLTGGGFFARAEAGVFGSALVENNLIVYSVILQLMGVLSSSSPAEPTTPATFPVHVGLLGVSSSNPFNFTYSACLGVGPFGPGSDSCTDAGGAATRIVTYQGTATLLESTVPPVPEPASLLLVATGIALIKTGLRWKK